MGTWVEEPGSREPAWISLCLPTADAMWQLPGTLAPCLPTVTGCTSPVSRSEPALPEADSVLFCVATRSSRFWRPGARASETWACGQVYRVRDSVAFTGHSRPHMMLVSCPPLDLVCSPPRVSHVEVRVWAYHTYLHPAHTLSLSRGPHRPSRMRQMVPSRLLPCVMR